MTDIKVKNRSLPSRCEICHQADLFDAERNHCSRCAGVPELYEDEMSEEEIEQIPVEQITEFMTKNLQPWIENSWIGFLPRLGFTINLLWVLFSNWQTGRLLYQPIFSIIEGCFKGFLTALLGFTIVLLYAQMRYFHKKNDLAGMVIFAFVGLAMGVFIIFFVFIL